MSNKALLLFTRELLIDKLRKDFENRIDSYLEGCKADGIEPIKTFSGK